jgi:opacity protein-like surface antigen
MKTLLLTLLLFIPFQSHAGWYGGFDLGYLQMRDGGNSFKWDDNNGIPIRVEVGYKSKPLNYIFYQPKFKTTFMHISNYEGWVLNEISPDSDHESQIDMFSIGLCWGDC